jgi:hypothetical protein
MEHGENPAVLPPPPPPPPAPPPPSVPSPDKKMSDSELIRSLARRIADAVTTNMPEISVVALFRKERKDSNLNDYQAALRRAIPLALTEIDDQKTARNQEIRQLFAEIEDLHAEVTGLRKQDFSRNSGIMRLRLQNTNAAIEEIAGAHAAIDAEISVIEGKIAKKGEELGKVRELLKKMESADLRTRFGEASARHWAGAAPSKPAAADIPPPGGKNLLQEGVTLRQLTMGLPGLKKLVLEASADEKGRIELSESNSDVGLVKNAVKTLLEKNIRPREELLGLLCLAREEGVYCIFKDAALKTIAELEKKMPASNKTGKQGLSSHELILKTIADKVLTSRGTPDPEVVGWATRKLGDPCSRFSTWKLEYMFLCGTPQEKSTAENHKVMPTVLKDLQELNITMNEDFAEKNNQLTQGLESDPPPFYKK